MLTCFHAVRWYCSCNKSLHLGLFEVFLQEVSTLCTGCAEEAKTWQRLDKWWEAAHHTASLYISCLVANGSIRPTSEVEPVNNDK